MKANRDRQCETCIYRPDSPLRERLPALEDEARDPAAPYHFIRPRACHSEGWPRAEKVCAGFAARHGDNCTAVRCAVLTQWRRVWSGFDEQTEWMVYTVKLAHARPGDHLERRDGNDWIVIWIVQTFAQSDQSGEPIRVVEYEDTDGERWRVNAASDPHDWRPFDPEQDARVGLATLAGAGSLPPAAPALTETQMLQAAARALGVRMISDD